MNLDLYKYVYLLGIGGIGMSALARYFNANGQEVNGYDKCNTNLSKELEKAKSTMKNSSKFRALKGVDDKMRHYEQNIFQLKHFFLGLS